MGMMPFDEIENRRDASRLGQWSSLLCAIALLGILGCPALQIISGWKVARIGIPVGAGAAIAGEIVERERLRKFGLLRRTEAMAAQSQALHFAHVLSPKQSLKLAQQPQMQTLQTYQWQQFKQEAAAALIVGNQGSGKDCVAKFLAAQFMPCQILVLDPHNKNTPWGGLPVVDETTAIIEQMRLLRQELEERIQNGKDGKPDRPPCVIFINEWLVIKDFCQRLKLKDADEFLSDFLPQCRKYRLIPILLVQAENVDAILPPSKGGLKTAFLIIRLCEAARNFAANLQNPEVRQAIINNPAYPAMVGSKLAIHPTHGHHSQFQLNGMLPANLMPLVSEALTIPNVLTDSLPPTSTSTSAPEVEVTRKSLEALYSKHFPTSTSTGSTSDADFPVWEEVWKWLESGKSQSWVVENILKCKGRRFAEGKSRLEELMNKYQKK